MQLRVPQYRLRELRERCVTLRSSSTGNVTRDSIRYVISDGNGTFHIKFDETRTNLQKHATRTHTHHPNKRDMPTSVYLLYDERMTLHRRIGTSFDADHLFEQDTESRQNDNFEAERPARILALYHALKMLERQLSQSHPDQRFLPLPCKPASKETICLAHSEDHYDRLAATRFLSDDELQELEEPNELYFCKHTFLAATLACGGVVECVNAVTEAFRTGVGSTRAIALVRPPGHHALRDNPMGKLSTGSRSRPQSLQ